MRRFLFIEGKAPEKLYDAFDQVIDVGDYLMHESVSSSTIYRRVVKLIDVKDRNSNGDIFETWGKTRYVKLLCEPVSSALDRSFYSSKLTWLEDSTKVIKLSDEQLEAISVRKQ